LQKNQFKKKHKRKKTKSTRVNSTNPLLGITNKKNGTNKKVQGLITNISNYEFEKKLIKGKKNLNQTWVMKLGLPSKKSNKK